MTQDDREDIKRHFDVVAESLRSEIQLVAEGVAMNTERLDRVEAKFDDFREETGRNFIDLRSTVKLSYSELDRRLTTLEGGIPR